MLVFLGLGALAFSRPWRKTSTKNVPYTQQVSFGYNGSAPSSPVYPNGVVSTGDPIFLQFVRQLHVHVSYSLTSSASKQLSGTDQLLLRVSGPTGWSRTMPLTPTNHFSGNHATADATLDLVGLQALVKRIQALTGVATPAGYTISVLPQVHVHGSLSGQPVTTSFNPVLSFQLAPPQLRPGAAASDSAPLQAALNPSQSGSLSAAVNVDNRLHVAGASVTVATLRDVAVGGFLLAVVAGLLLTVLIKRTEPFGEAGRIQAQYGHMIVPIAGTADDLAWAPFDVPNIEALVRLAEACDRLILHYREDTLDTYLVNDEGTVYRYQSRHSGVVWGEWSTAPVARLDSVPPPTPQADAARA
jgi:hypothetical protein